MRVKRIVATVAAADPSAADSFYREILGLELAMDRGWIRSYVGASQSVQIGFASEGGSGTPVPDLSVEVDDLDEALRRVQQHGLTPEYGPVLEPWGVRRFYVRDPLGKLVNILQHA
ncbi:MAG: VOC family protein [Stenotrophomonas sp.]|uniref:VOC family protein n=1 Tax=Stenotrophomonas sp. TaxID=69392 RepID=UPI0028AC97F2|nr:VOC family protein [Stenotrophomonas sp.]